MLLFFPLFCLLLLRPNSFLATMAFQNEFICYQILNQHKCDVIKQNESELANTVFKIQPNKADSFFCFLLLVQSFNCLYLWNQLPNLCGVFTKLKPEQYQIWHNRKCQKTYFLTSDSFCLIASQN